MFGEMLQNNVHLVKYKGQSLACSQTKPITILGFKTLKHAIKIQKLVEKVEYTIIKETPTVYKLNIAEPRPEPLQEMTVTKTPLSYITLLCKLNDLDFEIITDIETSDIIKMKIDQNIDTHIFTNMQMKKGNLEKLYNEGI